MTAFEFVFSLFGLLLGLSLAEVLGGLARTLKQWRTVRLGWLTPLLGLLVMLDLTSSWALAYSLKDEIPANFLTLVIGLFVTGLYYLAATLVFPDDASKWPDLDDYYFGTRGRCWAASSPRGCWRGRAIRSGTAGWDYFPAFAAFVVLDAGGDVRQGQGGEHRRSWSCSSRSIRCSPCSAWCCASRAAAGDRAGADQARPLERGAQTKTGPVSPPAP